MSGSVPGMMDDPSDSPSLPSQQPTHDQAVVPEVGVVVGEVEVDVEEEEEEEAAPVPDAGTAPPSADASQETSQDGVGVAELQDEAAVPLAVPLAAASIAPAAPASPSASPAQPASDSAAPSESVPAAAASTAPSAPAPLPPALNKLVAEMRALIEHGQSREACELVVKAREVLAQHPTALHSMLVQCQPASEGFAMLTVLCVMAECGMGAKPVSEQDIVQVAELTGLLINELSTEQARMCTHMYVTLFLKLTDYALSNNWQLEAIANLLERGVSLLCGEKGEGGETETDESVVSSMHGLLFAVSLKCGRAENALPFVYRRVRAVMDERPLGSQSLCYMDSKHLLLYLYYGGLVVARASQDWRRAASLMESAVGVTAAAASAIQIHAYKKLVLFSLLADRCSPNPSKSPAVTRAWKTHGGAYRHLAEAACLEARHADPVAECDKVLQKHHAVFTRDNSVGLIRLLIRELRDRAVLRVAKSFCSIRLSDLSRRSQLSEEDAREAVLRLQTSGRLIAQMDNGVVRMELPKQNIALEHITHALNRVSSVQSDAMSADEILNREPFYLARQIKSSMSAAMLDDEGLSLAAASSHLPGKEFMFAANCP